jgi:ketosteroid isomerase-like protein
MSEENVETTDVLEWAPRYHEAWNAEGVAGVVAFLAESVEWHDPAELPDATVYRGRDAVATHLRDWAPDGVFELKLSVEEARPAGDEIVVFVTVHGRGVQSGTPSAGQPVFYVYSFEGDRIARVRVFLDQAQALEAAGLSD